MTSESTQDGPARPRADANELIAEHRQSLLRFIRYLSRGVLSEEDICQEVMLRALQAKDRPQRPEEMVAWLFRIARNLVIDEVRKNKRRSRMIKVLENLVRFPVAPQPAALPSARSQLSQTQTASVLSAALQQLDEISLEMITLRFFAGLSTSQIAEALSVPIGTVCARVFRATRKLRDIVEKQGYSFTDLHYEG